MFGRLRLTLLAATLLTSAGCASNRAGTHEVNVHEFVFGAFGGRALDVRDVCGDRPTTSLATRRSGLDYLFSVLSLGLYLPHRIQLRCAEKP
ncbi:MAG: hypothetical protein QM756_26445 [Polyangiaceae bacterium]